MNAFKIVLIGNAQVGKSQYAQKLEGNVHTVLPPLIQNHINTHPQDENNLRTILGAHKVGTYTPTLGVEVYILKFRTTVGTITVNLYEISGSHRPGFQSHYGASHAVIIMSTPSTTQNISSWLQEANTCAPQAKKYNCHNVNGTVTIAGTDKDPMEFILKRLTNNNSLRLI